MLSFSMAPVEALDAEQRLLLRAARCWVVIACRRQCPRATMQALVGESAGRFGMMMEQVTSAWPEPFTTFAPCACAVAPDEATLLTMLRLAGEGDAQAFHDQLCDMLPISVRERLWRATAAVAADWMAAR